MGVGLNPPFPVTLSMYTNNSYNSILRYEKLLFCLWITPVFDFWFAFHYWTATIFINFLP